LASLLLVGLLLYTNPQLFNRGGLPSPMMQWLDLVVWGCVLVLTGYMMGTLYEHKNAQIKELRTTYYGVLEILRYFVANDKFTENHSYRVSVYATRIAGFLGLASEQVEDVRAAALLHDIGKLQIGRELLYKAAALSDEEFSRMREHVRNGVEILESVGGSLRRVLPIVLAHHERFDGAGYQGQSGDDIPVAARVIRVADVYDALTSDRPYRKAITPFEAKDVIVKGAGTEFDPAVVEAFRQAFRAGALELPQLVEV
jgi:putative nucleotidyltransferase with HDIG domain